jgi:hypothetical protein
VPQDWLGSVADLLHSGIRGDTGPVLWIIIGIALALIVLVLLSTGFLSRWQIFGQSLDTCDKQCVADRSQCPPGSAGVPMKTCLSGSQKVENGFCCVPYQ